jgi:SET domain-containing protein
VFTKQELLSELSLRTYVALQPSTIAGIGVFALVDIAKGANNFFGPPDKPDDWIKISLSEFETLPAHAQFLVQNYCLFDNDGYFVPANGFKKMDISLFLNHSDTPNIKSINDGDYFEAIKDIKAGEELFVDYGEIVDE